MRIFNNIILFVFISTSLFGQNKLSEEELKIFQVRAVEYVSIFEFYIKQIAQSKSLESKNADILAASNLFDEKATIEISNLNGTKRKLLLTDYLSKVVARYSEKYEVVVIDFVAAKIENLKEKQDKNGKIYYEGTFKFVQHFYAERKSINSSSVENRKFTYGDVTHKKGKIILKQVTTVIGDQWILKLGDISVDETKPLDP